MEELKIQDNGETEVQIATIGKVVGSDIDGNPIEQNFTEEALQKIADSQKEEILVDEDHSSEVGGCTSAKGWLSDLKFVAGKGLMGVIKWTSVGKELIQGRVFRWLSPSWILNDDKTPAYMTSVALTNKPSQMGRIDPIINSKPTETISNAEETSETNEKEILDMTKEELKELIKETLAEIKAEKKAEEIKEEIKEEVINEEVKTDETKSEEQVENACAKNEEVKEEVKTDEVKEEVKNEEVKEEKKEEVVKIEALNSAPTPIIEKNECWRNLKGQAFFDYIKKNNIR